MSARAAGRSNLAMAALVAPAFALLVGLGVWQVERLQWKTDVIARIEARTHAAPKPLPPESAWPGLVPDDYEYSRVTARGVYEHEREALIYRGSGKVAGALNQPGYWVMTPLRLADGSRVLVNRGFVGLDRKEPSKRAGGAAAGEVEIVGVMRAPEARGAFTPADSPAKGEWYTRDPLAIAATLKLERAAPFSIDEDAHAGPSEAPAGGATVIDIPNNHLSYALTWFGLAATLAIVTAAFMRRRRREA